MRKAHLDEKKGGEMNKISDVWLIKKMCLRDEGSYADKKIHRAFVKSGILPGGLIFLLIQNYGKSGNVTRWREKSFGSFSSL